MFQERIAELNRINEQNPVCFEKRTYTVDEIQDILGVSRPTAYNLVKQELSAVCESAVTSVFPKKALMNGWIKMPYNVKGVDSVIGTLTSSLHFSYNWITQNTHQT